MSKGESFTSAGAVIYIGEFQLQPDLNLLHKDGNPLPLGDRAINVLKSLAKRPQQTVPREVLMQEAWVDRTGHRLIVEPGNLQVQIFNLRRVLGKNAIRTVLDCGYALVLPVFADDEQALMFGCPEPRDLSAAIGAYAG